MALLGVTPSFVTGLLTIFMPVAMRKFEARTVLVTCQILNTVGALMVALLTNYQLLLAGRVLNGIAQAFTCSYSPVWINEFAPRKS